MENKELMRGLEEYREKIKSGDIEIQKKTMLDRFLEQPTPVRAIKRMCLECSGFERKMWFECDCVSCPLWLLRRGSTYTEEDYKIWKSKYIEHLRLYNELDSSSVPDED